MISRSPFLKQNSHAATAQDELESCTWDSIHMAAAFTTVIGAKSLSDAKMVSFFQDFRLSDALLEFYCASAEKNLAPVL